MIGGGVRRGVNRARINGSLTAAFVNALDAGEYADGLIASPDVVSAVPRVIADSFALMCKSGE
jgi:hypothetical protein